MAVESDTQQEMGEFLSIQECCDEATLRAYLTHGKRRKAFADRIETIVQNREQIARKWKPRGSGPDALKKHLRSKDRTAISIVGYAFGFGPRKGEASPVRDPKHEQYHPHYHDAGGSNRDIARMIDELAGVLNLAPASLYGQWEVVEALRLNHERCIPDEHAAIPKLYAGEYLSTQGVAQQLLQCGLYNYESIIVVGHPDHLLRCLAATDIAVNHHKKSLPPRQGRKAEILLADTVGKVQYYEDSLQKWTRSAAIFRQHEIRARLKSLRNGGLFLEHFKSFDFE